VEASVKIKMTSAISILLLICACTSSAGVYSDPGSPIEIPNGSRFSIELDSNPTTGYAWVFGTPLEENIIRLVRTDYINPESTLAGAGGAQVWVFKALQPGTTTVVLDYQRSWEAQTPIQTAVFVIIVN
jgi:predicted secreted protein